MDSTAAATSLPVTEQISNTSENVCPPPAQVEQDNKDSTPAESSALADQPPSPRQLSEKNFLPVTRKLQKIYLHADKVLSFRAVNERLRLYLLNFKHDGDIPATSDPVDRRRIDVAELFNLSHDLHKEEKHLNAPETLEQPVNEIPHSNSGEHPNTSSLEGNNEPHSHQHHHHNHKESHRHGVGQDSRRIQPGGTLHACKILILGGPQVGKSTLLEQIATQWSQESLFHQDFRAVFHIRFGFFFTNWRQFFTAEELHISPLICYVWFCVEQEPGYNEIPIAERLTKEEVFQYWSTHTKEETLYLVHRFDQVDQYLQSLADNSVEERLFDELFEQTHVIFSSREGITCSPTMRRFDCFVEGRVLVNANSSGSNHQIQSSVHSISRHNPPTSSEVHSCIIPNTQTPETQDALVSQSQPISAERSNEDLIPAMKAMDVTDTSSQETHSKKNLSSNGSNNTRGSSGADRKRIYPEVQAEEPVDPVDTTSVPADKAEFMNLAQNMIMNCTVIMECEKLGFTNSERLDDLQSRLAVCIESNVKLFDQFSSKEVIDAFTSQLHRSQVLVVVLEPARALDTNYEIVEDSEFWKQFVRSVRTSLTGESSAENDVEDQIVDAKVEGKSTTHHRKNKCIIC